MDFRREYILALLLIYMVKKYVIMGILALEKFYNFVTKYLDDDDGTLYCTRTEGQLSEEMLTILKIWRFFETYVYEIIL